MRKMLRWGLLGLCAGMLSLPAWASGPEQVRVAVVNAKGVLTTPVGLTYQVEGKQRKAKPGADGTVVLRTDGADRISFAIDGQTPVELNLKEDTTNILVTTDGRVTKLVSGSGMLRARASQLPQVGANVASGAMVEPLGARLSNAVRYARNSRQGSDSCTGAEAISGLGNFDFDNTNATNEGPNHPACLEFGFDSIPNDVWFCWTAPDDGDYEVATCDLTTIDTKIAVYDSCVCPSDSSTLIDCNDDTCALQSTVNFNAVGGQSYLIRVGIYPNATPPGGVGQFTISASTPPPPPPPAGDCNEPVENCQLSNPADALNATGGLFNVAEDFVVTNDGQITGLCWFGGYFDGVGDCVGSVTDAYSVTYYADNDGFPGAVLASFSQSGGTLNATGPGSTGNLIAGFLPEYVLTAEHAPVDVSANTCYWLEISNEITGCSFFWTTSDDGNGRLLQDGTPPNGYDLIDAVVNDVAFCLDMELGDPNCTPAPADTPCDLPDENCQTADQINALTSTAGLFTVADDFETPAGRASLTNICWTGGGQDAATGGACTGPDNFTVRYFEDNAGEPGGVIATYSQSNGTLTVDSALTGLLIAGALPEVEYTGSHEPLALADGACYWIEITNDSAGCDWFWGTSGEGNGVAFQDGDGFVPPDGYSAGDRVTGDLSFCLNTGLGDAGNCLPPPPANDECENAESVDCNGSATGDNTFATSVPSDPNFSCRFGTPGPGVNSIWYSFMATDTSAFLDTNASTGASDTLLAVYDGSCGSLVEIGCSEDEGDGLLSEVCVEGLTVGTTYYVQVASFSATTTGSITLNVQCPCPAPPEPPANDDCEDAIAIDIPSLTAGDTTLATLSAAPECDTSVTAPGVWYLVEGTGTTITASLCNGNTGYDSKLTVYCADCDDPVCVVGNDDTCGLQSEVSFCSQVGSSYLILVHGFSSAVGAFELEVTEDGQACTASVSCLPAGACCLPNGDCVILPASECEDAQGAYQGEGTNCGGSAYVLTTCNNNFDDISGTGSVATVASNNDDDGDPNIPIGFTFTFFGADYTEIGVASNGYMSFDGNVGDLSNDAIPTTTTPNALIAGLWDDLAPNADPNAVIYYETRGSAPNREFIVQWTGVPQFASEDDNTFQVVLFEGSNAIEMRYASITPEGFVGDYTIGIENADGTDGVAADAGSVAAGDCLRFELQSDPNPCDVITLDLDLMPGKCPNILRRGPNGPAPTVTAALLGDESFDISQIDVSAGITIERVDGVGSPLNIVASNVDDVATPLADDGCNCHDLGADGTADLVIDFDRPAFRAAIELAGVALGSDIPLVVKGQLLDGTAFQAFDCLTRIRGGNPLPPVPLPGDPATNGGRFDAPDVRIP